MPPLSDKLEEVERLCDAGELWRARAVLQGLTVTYGYSPEVFALKGDVHLRMHDLPAAGAVYFLHGAETDEEQDALEAYRRICGGNVRQMAVQAGLLRCWGTLPAHRLGALRAEIGEDDWEALKRAHDRPRRPHPEEMPPRSTGCAVGLLILLLFAAIGALLVFSFIWDALKYHYF